MGELVDDNGQTLVNGLVAAISRSAPDQMNRQQGWLLPGGLHSCWLLE